MSPSRVPRRSRLLVVASLAVAGCTPIDPAPAPPSPTVAPGVPGLQPPDAREDQLEAEVQALSATLQAARSALEEAGRATELTVARAAGERAVHALTMHPELTGDLDGDGQVAPLDVTALFPGPPDAIPEDSFYGDQLSSTMTAARGAGRTGAGVVDVLRDPVAGDLGVWQADPGSVLDEVRRAADAGSLDAVEQAIADLDGQATRALVWSLVTVRADDLATATGAAQRGTAHLDVTVDALASLPAPD